MQETYLRLMERPPAADDNLRGWLFTVATNLARDTERVARRRLVLAEEAADRIPTGRPPRDPAARAEQRDARARIAQALAHLSDKERTALLLREEGFTHREIAAAVETTTQSVGTLIARALEKAARHLTPELRP